MPTEIARTEQRLAALSVLEAAFAAWKTHAALLAAGGVVVTGLAPGGQAEKIGLQPGDILIRYQQTRLDKSETLRAQAKAADPARPVTIELLRGAQKLTVKAQGGPLGITIAELPPNPAAAP